MISYDRADDDMNNDNYDNNSYNTVGLRNDQLFQFCRKTCKLRLDNAELALLTAISVFSEREGLEEQRKVRADKKYPERKRLEPFISRLTHLLILFHSFTHEQGYVFVLVGLSMAIHLHL